MPGEVPAQDSEATERQLAGMLAGLVGEPNGPYEVAVVNDVLNTLATGKFGEGWGGPDDPRRRTVAAFGSLLVDSYGNKPDEEKRNG